MYLTLPQGQQPESVWDVGKLDWMWSYDDQLDSDMVKAIVVLSEGTTPDIADQWVTSLTYKCYNYITEPEDNCMKSTDMFDDMSGEGSWMYGGPSISSLKSNTTYYWGVMAWYQGDELSEDGAWETSDVDFPSFTLPEKPDEETPPPQSEEQSEEEKELQTDKDTKNRDSNKSGNLGGTTGSLTEDFKLAITRNATGDTDIDAYAKEMAHSVANFLVSQKASVTKLQVPVGVDSIKTTENLSVDVSPDTLMGPYAPVINVLKKLASLVPGGSGLVGAMEGLVKQATRQVSEGGSSLPALDIREGKQGGTIDVTGICELDTLSEGRTSPEGLSAESEVVYFSDKITNLDSEK